MVVNFRAYKISKGASKLTQISIFIKNNNNVDNYECRILHEIFIVRYKKILKIVTA